MVILYVNDTGLDGAWRLYDYETAEYIRAATDAESVASYEQSQRDGGAGVITVDGRRCYVQR